MKKDLFKEGLEAIVDYVAEELKKEIEYQLNSIAIGENYWGNEDEHCNLEVSLSHLKIANDFLREINDCGEADQEELDGMYLILYDEPYYKFNIAKILKDSDIEADTNEFNKILISYLKGDISIDDIDDDEKKEEMTN